ncbi:MAG: histidine kinase [Chloroflexota bacterium]|nr:histidine kinase [Chloroflexota bacterium]
MAEFRTDPRARDELITMLSAETKRVRDKLSEIKIQVDQTQIVVEREQSRNNDIMSELRAVQDNIETVPRQDIRQRYDDALEGRYRLLTMRGQLEKFASIREQLDSELTMLREVLGRLQGIEALPATTSAGSEESVESGRGAGMNIVRIVQAQEEERQRLARQMHDGPAQSMSNFILQAEICHKLFDRNPARAAEELDSLKTTASITFQKIREFIFDLRPMMLDDLGVMPTVRRYVDSFKDKNDIKVKLDIMGDERRLESHREVLIFRSIQELMGMARDYANAEQLTIRLDLSGNTGRILVQDNGRGFDAESAFSNEEGNHDARVSALITLREKFDLVRGSVVVESKESEGTSVRVELPLED